MKNIHLIPTDKPSRLGYLTKKGKEVYKDLRLFDKPMPNILDSENQHIYITSDEEIKDGDWMIRGNEQPTLVTPNFFWDFGVRYYKIILTTDQDLIEDGVQAIDDEFLEWFVENPSCEEVKVRKNPKVNFIVKGKGVQNFNQGYKIIIPKEEFKQEPERGITITHVGKQETKMIECYFIPNNNTSSTTICGNCGKEKFLHTIGSGIKVSKSVILTQEEPKQEKINMNTHYVDFSNPNADNISSASTTSMKQDNNFYEKLKQYFEETPREKILEDWAKSAEFDNVGPTVDDFLNNTNKQEQTFKQKLVIELNEYDYTGSSNDIYGMVVKVNGVEMPYHNLDVSTILEEVLEHLGYEVEIIETLDR
jgi:hypothetical protein